MSTQHTELLELLLQKERERRDEARVALQRVQRQLHEHETQEAGLRGYRVDYGRRWSAQFQQGARMEIVTAYHAFLARLDEAINQQLAVVGHARRQVEHARERVVAREIRVATVERLIQRQRQAAAHQASRRDQKQLDEMAARSGQRRALAGLA